MFEILFRNPSGAYAVESLNPRVKEKSPGYRFKLGSGLHINGTESLEIG